MLAKLGDEEDEEWFPPAPLPDLLLVDPDVSILPCSGLCMRKSLAVRAILGAGAGNSVSVRRPDGVGVNSGLLTPATRGVSGASGMACCTEERLFVRRGAGAGEALAEEAAAAAIAAAATACGLTWAYGET